MIPHAAGFSNYHLRLKLWRFPRDAALFHLLGEPDPVKTALEARETVKETEAQTTPETPEETRQRRLLEWFNSDWTPPLRGNGRAARAGGNRTPTQPPRLLVGVKGEVI